MILSKKQIQLYNDIVSEDIPNISVLGSTQSGKTYDICLAVIEYARRLRQYEIEQREEGNIPRQYIGAIVGWTTDTVKSNIVDNLTNILENEYHFKEGKDYVLKYGQQDKYIEVYGMKFYFFGFNNKLSFNKILGKPLIFVWIDESARIYSHSGELRATFDEFPGRQMSYSGHPFRKRIDSFNVEGNQNHPYKVKYIDNTDWKKYVFYPYDNPVLDTEEKIREAIKAFPEGSLREQKVFNKWVVAEGKVFNKINKLDNIDKMIIREIGIGIDYGSVNPTTFVPIALAYNQEIGRWCLIRLETYYHDPKVEGDTPTTEYYSLQLRLFLLYLKDKYPNIPITEIVIDSEASHFDNRLTVDNIEHSISKKGAGSVDSGVQYLQSLFYKDFLYILDRPTIRYFLPNGEYEEANKDESLIEFESYQYDRLKSEVSGTNCYVKELDHSIDATRYILEVFKESNRSPVV